MQILPFRMNASPALYLSAQLVKPLSVGTLRLRSADPREQPDMRLNLDTHPEDMRRHRAAVRLLSGLFGTAELRAIGAGTVVLDKVQSMPAAEFAKLAEQDAWVDDFVQRVVRHYVHPVGTARMGPKGDPGAVVDQYGRVHGVAGLLVADASVMPAIPSANTHLTCVMISERVAAWMRAQDD
jgi:choline dehydrogenase